ncbi:MjaI family restriction endonuclease [Leptospira wolffii]|uniref:MjaI family restriction endonuclease n=1 Tax=Leptospira wolffii TaxID=409998 RepID=UPI001083FE13|nr:MjaI family restriction endonuclease [Leptospira wolffii]TGL53180.1 MjaI family restriction endonuclease [Leptospira wolffii]
MSKKARKDPVQSKDSHLNRFLNLYQINHRRNIGDMELHLAKALPSSEEDWINYYLTKVRNNGQLQELGERLFDRIRTQALPSIEAITEEDCITYVRKLALDKTYQGYISRLIIHQEQLLKETGALFIYKPEHPNDWLFKTWSIDMYFKSLEKDLLVGIKFLPETARIKAEPTILEMIGEINEEHRRLREREAGHFTLLFYKKEIENYSIASSEEYNKILSIFDFKN